MSSVIVLFHKIFDKEKPLSGEKCDMNRAAIVCGARIKDYELITAFQQKLNLNGDTFLSSPFPAQQAA